MVKKFLSDLTSSKIYSMETIVRSDNLREKTRGCRRAKMVVLSFVLLRFLQLQQQRL